MHSDNPFAVGPRPRTLVELLRDRAVQQPEHRVYTFLTDGAESVHLTCQELDRQARAIGVRLQQLEAAGERVLLLYPPGLEFIAGFFGCLYSGAIAIPAPQPNPSRLKRTLPRLQAIARDAQATLGLTTAQSLAMIQEISTADEALRSIRWIATDQANANDAEEWRNPSVEPESLAYLQYTSGSTSTPKGVMLSHANVLHNSDYIRQAWSYVGDSRSVVWIPHFHDDGLVHGILQPLFTGFASYLMSPLAFVQQPVRWLRAISHHRGTHTGGPNFCYELCLRKVSAEQRETLDLSSWQVAYNAAEPIRAETLERFAESFKSCGFRRESFYPAYGLAEATLLVTTKRKNTLFASCAVEIEALEGQGRVVLADDSSARARVLVGCGHAVEQTKVVSAHPETLRQCAPGEVGEILVLQPSVARGYWSRPDETAQTFHAYLADTGEGPFLRTGDLGFIRDGEVFITGRLKDLIIIRGQNHYPQDIEWTAERSHPLLRQGCSAAFSVDVSGEERLVVALEVESGPRVETGHTPLDYEVVIGAIRQAVLDQHDLQPYAIVLIEAGSIHKTSSGKIQRSSCRIDFLNNELGVIAEWKQDLREASSAPRVETGATSRSRVEIQDWLIAQLCERVGLGAEEIDLRAALASYGLDSKDAVSLTGELEVWLGRRLAPTLLYEYPTIEVLARHLSGEEKDQPSKSASLPDYAQREPIAIIGIGCRFPGAEDVDSFWNLLRNGAEAITEIPRERWDIDAFYDPDWGAPGKVNTRRAGFLDQVEYFDAHFFGISPREAARMDPQQRLLMEVAWEAFADAGQTLNRLAGSQTGVFVGISTNEYGWLQLSDLKQLDAQWATGNSLSIAANRLSYALDLRGPSIAVDTACSSSLVAAHLACASLWNGESDLALAGGVSLILTPAYTINLTKAGVMSPDGRCKVFDASANGYVRGEGAGVVVLKPLSRALADGDPIYAVIRGSAVMNDGRSNGLMAPNRQAQEALLLEAYRRAGVTPGQVQYVETHGTGTFLGDPIEARALGTVLALGRKADDDCAIGSVKTNIGHLEAAAGIAGLIKLALALKHQEIPPSLNFTSPNPHIPFAELRLRVQQSLDAWPKRKRPALGGVSSFGFGGTGAHIVLESFPRADGHVGSSQGRAQLLPLSARSPEALLALGRSYHELLDRGHASANGWLANLCYSASERQSHHDYRLAVVGQNEAALAQQLATYIKGESGPAISTGRRYSERERKIVFIFSGHGSQRSGMGQELLAQEPVFRQTLEDCDRALRPYTGWSVVEALAADEESSIRQTDFIQPAIFAIQVALAAMWRSWGIEPAAVVGHSMGEVAAACVAGALTLDDAAKVISNRSRLLSQVSGSGQMAAVELSYEEAERLLEDYAGRLFIAVSNSPTSTVIAGDPAALEEVLEKLRGLDKFCRLVNIDVASHTPQIESLRGELLQALAGLEPQSPGIPIYSTVTGSANARFDAEYWWRNMRQPVLFSKVIEELREQDHDVFLEISPHPVLLTPIQQVSFHLKKESSTLASLHRDASERATMLTSLGALYALGQEVNWPGLYPHGGEFIRLPRYPWQREPYWFGVDQKDRHATEPSNGSQPIGDNTLFSTAHAPSVPQGLASNNGAAASATNEKMELENWLYQVEWQRKELRESSTVIDSPRHWLIFADKRGAGLALKSILEARGDTCFLISGGDSYKLIAPQHYQANPCSPDDMGRLIHETSFLKQQRRGGIVHLWSLDAAPSAGMTMDALEASQALGCLSVLHLTQGLMSSSVSSQSVMPRLWLVTCRAQAVGESAVQSAAQSVAQSPLWGLARTIRLEQPELDCSIVDLGSVDSPEQISALSQELLSGDQDDQVALRGNQRFVARLVSSIDALAQPRENTSACAHRLTVPTDNFFRLQLTEPGSLDELSLREAPAEEPGPGEIKIRVYAAGLNFVDVLRALDIIPARDGGALSLGAECAGVVRAVGAGVNSFQVGDEVIAIARGCFGSYAIAGATLAVRKPERLSFTEASTIPIAFLTAYYALVRLANLATGERVLIHAATGGVGLAALQIARNMGAEIFATAGSAKKREYLRTLGVSHVMDSRSLTFSDEILERTSSEGVDVVLNSLAGEAIPKGLATLRTYGRFLEIGKRDIALNSQVGLLPFQKNLSFFAIDLDRMCQERPKLVGSMLQEIIDQVEARTLVPIPQEVFHISSFKDAFRRMAQARHIGKIVVQVPDGETVEVSSSIGPAQFRADASYLISGGTGGLGLTIAEWMVRRGAKHLVLVSRGGVASSQAAVDEMRKAGAQVVLAAADVAQPQQVSKVITEIDRNMPPLRGVIHAAGLLADGLIASLDQEKWRAVMAPKVSGAWVLHTQTLNLPLDFFALCSSAASLLGSPGQANYAAANAFLDALAHHRRALGLPCVCINWGPWAEVGLAAQPNRAERLELKGVKSVTPELGLRALERILSLNATQVGVFSVDWSQWQKCYPAAGRGLLDSLCNKEETKKPQLPLTSTNLTRQMLLESEEQQRLIENYLRDRVASALGMEISLVKVNKPLNSLGFDSLLAVELKHRIEIDLGVSVPVTKFLHDTAITQLALFIMSQLAAPDSAISAMATAASAHHQPKPQTATPIPSGAPPEQLLAQLDQFSNQELDSLLTDLLAQDKANDVGDAR